MSQTISPSVSRPYGLERVCRAWDASRSTFYSRQKKVASGEGNKCEKPGPKPGISDNELLAMIRTDIITTPFKGEGHEPISINFSSIPE